MHPREARRRPFLSRCAASLPRARKKCGPRTVSYKSLYSFGHKADDGDEPLANLTVVGEKLYGTTEIGGETTQFCFLGCGSVFFVTTSGAQSVTYRFKGGADGALPAAGLLLLNGKLFGTTNGGGNAAACSGGCGTVFALGADGKSGKDTSSIYRGHRRRQPRRGSCRVKRYALWNDAIWWKTCAVLCNRMRHDLFHHPGR